MDTPLSDAILVDALPGDVRVAVVSQGRVTDLLVDRASHPLVSGSVFVGRVTGLAPQIKAAFVEIGLDRAGFLNQADVPDGVTLTEGTRLLVQAVAEPISDAGGEKGAKLTAKVTLPHRLLVLTPGDGQIRVSHKIKDKARRDALTERLTPLRPSPKIGMVVRTGAAQATDAELTAAVAATTARWEALVQAQAAASQGVKVLYHDDAVQRALRLATAQAPILVSGPDATARVQDLGSAARVWTGRQDLFAVYGVDDAFAQALGREVVLPGGGSIVIERTAAVTAIDVNIGTASRGGRDETALAVNLAAAETIATQVRLRNLGGLFVIDFARMKRKGDGDRVLRALRDAGANDPLGLNVAGETRYGLVEMTRPRSGGALADALAGACGVCGGAHAPSAETAAFDGLRALLREAKARPGVRMGLMVSADVAAALNHQAKAAQDAVAQRLGMPVDIATDAAMLPGACEVTETAP